MSPCRVLRGTGLALAAGAALWSSPVDAHDFDPGVLAIVEERTPSAITHRFKLTQPTNTRAAGREVRVRFPTGCVVDERAYTLSCAPGAFAGDMGLAGVRTDAGRTRVIVSLSPREGGLLERVIEDDASFVLAPGGDPRAGTSAISSPTSSFSSWAELGARHLLGGPDHLAFLIGLLALVTTRRALLLAITAFSLGHAISLGLSVTGVLAVPVAPTEALIALSVVLVAREGLALAGASDPSAPSSSPSPSASLLRRAPFLVSAIFGLVHGLGFASALGDRGFPREGLARALFAFHVGIEAAQLLIVAAVGLVFWFISSRAEAFALSLRTAGLYAIGTGGAFWCCERVMTVWRG